MKGFIVAAALLGFCLTGHAETPRPAEPGKEEPAAKPEWSFQGLIDTIDNIEWKGEWVPWIVPSPFGPGPAIFSSLAYNWQARTLTVEFLAYQKSGSLREHPGGETCQGIAQHAKSILRADPAQRALANVLEALPNPDTGSVQDESSAGGGNESGCKIIVKVTIQASLNDKSPYEVVSSCEISLPTEPDRSDEKAAARETGTGFD
jgi:hypothetical protein